MKYTFKAFDANSEAKVIAHVNVRADAKLETIVRKCLEELATKMNQALTAKVEWPNVWANGAVGTIILTDGNNGTWFTELFRDDNGILIFA